MLITDKDELKSFHSKYRVWQGIPGIEVTKQGKIYATFYSGGTQEDIGNFALLLRSDDQKTFSEPIAVAYVSEHRCYDSCVWIDPLDRLWFTWSYAPEHAVYGAICTNPDADILEWSDVFKIGNDVMMNKPTVLSSGEWLFPIAVWNNGLYIRAKKYETKCEQRGSYVYKTNDNGVTFQKLGYADVPKRSYDEHRIIELKCGVLAMYVRTSYGIGISYSYDNGTTWTKGKESGIYGPCSRFHITRLKSGRLLLVYHSNTTERKNLTAMLSEDDGKTWKYSLLLDSRNDVSYPDVKEAADGYIYIIYDRERGGFFNTLDEALGQAREILYSRIKESDIINGAIADSGSFTQRIISKLGNYEGNDDLYSTTVEELVDDLICEDNEKIISTLFERYRVNCTNFYKMDYVKLDELFEKLENTYAETDRRKVLNDIVRNILKIKKEYNVEQPIIERAKKYISNNLSENLSIAEIAEQLCLSKYYLCHIFKKETGVTLKEYERGLKIHNAKKLLIDTNMTVQEIAFQCGFDNTSYFCEQFIREECVSPGRYRQLLKNTEGHDKDIIYNCMIEHCNLLDKDITYIDKGDNNTDVVVLPNDEYLFLHEAAIVAFDGVLFAAWYNNKKHELLGETPIFYSRSYDNGKTWEDPICIVNDTTAKILYCPPVFLVENDKLYMMINTMVSPDHIHSLDLYVYDGKSNFDKLWSRPIPFKLNTNAYRLNNGKLILPGRVGEIDGFPNTPAVMISETGKVDDEWKVVKIQEDGSLKDGSEFVHPEVSLIVNENEIYAFCRNDNRNVPILYKSADGGYTWSSAIGHDIPFSASKIYSGSLSNGINYVIGNIDQGRNKLVIYFSEKNTMLFNKCYVLQDGFSSELGFGVDWHYPSAYEYDGMLYIIYTATLNKNNERGAVISRINIDEL